MLPALLLFASLVNDVRGFIAHHDLGAAERAVRDSQQHSGATPELAAALSWMARGELDAGDYDRAETYAAETRKMADGLLRTRKLDAEPWLVTALGASIEVHARVLASRGEQSEAVVFLGRQLEIFNNPALRERTRKNLNLLDLTGKAAPPLETGVWLGPKPVSLAQLRGHPVLLFFWAHWCPDCKAEAPILTSLRKNYASKGLVILGPTRLYGYVAGGEEAGPQVEMEYIEKVRRQYYSALADMPAPVSATNFQAYGASTTPTLILLDAAGIVRFYHPGALPEAELSARIQAILKQ